MCIPTVIVVLGLLGATLSTFGQFFMDHFSFVLSSVIFLMLAEHVTLYAAAVSRQPLLLISFQALIRSRVMAAVYYYDSWEFGSMQLYGDKAEISVGACVSSALQKMDGILSSLLFPVFTFVILRISFLQAVMWNIFFVLAFTIRWVCLFT